MRVKRFIGLALAAVLALAVAGIAVAHGGGKTGPTEAAQATITATPVADKSKTTTCTGVDGTYAISRQVFTGTSTGDPRLTGDLIVKAKSVVNQDKGLGTSEGTVFIKGTGDSKARLVAHYLAVVTQGGGKLDGFLTGVAKNADGTGTTSLAANFSVAANQDGSQITGELGSNDPVAPDNSAVFFGRPCKPETPASQYQESNDHHGHGHGHKGGKGGRHGGGDDK
jgi:hypothetical protein